MSKESVATLNARLAQDEELRVALAQATSVDDVVAVVRGAGIAVSHEDIEMASAAADSSPGELNEAELEGVAAGGFTTYGCHTPTQYFVFTHCYP
jgi:predicted ribosomally synthesized peptide with nif11-like leader